MIMVVVRRRSQLQITLGALTDIATNLLRLFQNRCGVCWQNWTGGTKSLQFLKNAYRMVCRQLLICRPDITWCRLLAGQPSKFRDRVSQSIGLGGWFSLTIQGFYISLCQNGGFLNTSYPYRVAAKQKSTRNKDKRLRCKWSILPRSFFLEPQCTQ